MNLGEKLRVVDVSRVAFVDGIVLGVVNGDGGIGAVGNCLSGLNEGKLKKFRKG